MTPMRVKTAREVPEYEIDPKELDFTNSVDITKVFLTLIAFSFAHAPVLQSFSRVQISSE